MLPRAALRSALGYSVAAPLGQNSKARLQAGRCGPTSKAEQPTERPAHVRGPFLRSSSSELYRFGNGIGFTGIVSTRGTTGWA